MSTQNTEFERLCRENRQRDDIKKLNRELKDDSVPATDVQNLNKTVDILTGRYDRQE